MNCASRAGPTCDAGPLGLGLLAGGGIGPVAGGPDDAPFDPPAYAGESGVLDDRIIDRTLGAVRHDGLGGAKAARDAVGGPGAHRDLVHVLEIEDAQLGHPVAPFLGVEVAPNAAERPRFGAER